MADASTLCDLWTVQVTSAESPSPLTYYVKIRVVYDADPFSSDDDENDVRYSMTTCLHW